MTITYDSEVDVLSITFRDTTAIAKLMVEGIAVEYDAEGTMVGIAILDAVKRFGSRETLR